MSKVAVLDTNKQILEPCHPAQARRLLKNGEAAVWQRVPFTIILKKDVPEDEVVTNDYTLSWDPGSRTSGMAVVSDAGEMTYLAELHHRGYKVKRWLKERSAFRRGRRTRNLRYRPARWANRSRKVPVLTDAGWTYQKADIESGADDSKTQNMFNRVSWAQFRDKRYRWERLPDTKTNRNQKKRWKRTRVEHKRRADNGWVAPSLMSRVFNLETWTRRLCKVFPITKIAIESVKFDMHLMQKPGTTGIQYQRGTLHGREIREYLLELTKRKCAYCGQGNQKLEVEHIIPKSRGGTDRVDNLTMACKPCNRKKSNLVGAALEAECGEEFAAKVKSALRNSKKGLTDAAAVNTIRWKLYETMKATGIPVESGTGGKTSFHRICGGLPKTHYYDAAAVACIPLHPQKQKVDVIEAVGYGRRDNVGYKFVMKAPGFRVPSYKRSHADGYAKYDHVEMTRRDGTKWQGIINCFDKTADGKPARLRVQYFDPDVKDARRVGSSIQLRRLRCRDGFMYGKIDARTDFYEPRMPESEPEPQRVEDVEIPNAITGMQLDMFA